ncbi:MAG TPA: Rieske 2Fe-2S domain-containing protein [Solirubrobacteraceae bacterium]|nr:Rieske 2Fe-2S domain-containing protein [Solirubrobacteraceae bacterium]
MPGPGHLPAPGHPAGPAERDARQLGRALLGLRLFLGVTFLYGGIQKLSDPGYLHPGAPTYIGTQLHGFAHATPGGFILRALAIPHPVLAGVGVALAEIAIGLLATAGLWTRAAAAAGLALNLLLLATNSWHTYPYFLGSDIVFVFAWLPFVLVGARRQPTLRSIWPRLLPAVTPGPPTDPPLTRRAMLSGAAGLAVGTAAIAGVSYLRRGEYRSPRALGAGAAGPPGTPAPPPASAGASPQTATSSAPPGPALPAGAVKLGPSSRLGRGQGATYSDPGDGNPALVIRQGDGSLTALSAVCTHAGCTVAYAAGQIACPCHGATFDPRTGAATGGPANDPLAPRRVIEQAGQIYAVAS